MVALLMGEHSFLWWIHKILLNITCIIGTQSTVSL